MLWVFNFVANTTIADSLSVLKKTNVQNVCYV